MTPIVLIFGVPMLVASVMLTPTGMGDVLYGVCMMSLVWLVVGPIVAWRVFLTELAFPSCGLGTLAALIDLWIGGAILVSVLLSLLGAMLDYSSTATGNPAGHILIPYRPSLGLKIGACTVCMFASCGVWGAFAGILPARVVIQGAFVTGLVAFGLLAAIAVILTS